MYTLSGAQYFGSLGDIARLDPKDSSVTTFSSGDGVHGYDVQSGLPQLAHYICNSTYPVVSLDEEGGLGPNELDAALRAAARKARSLEGTKSS